MPQATSSPFRPLVLLCLTAVPAGTTGAAPRPDGGQRFADEIRKAKDDYTAALRRADDRLLSAFDRALDSLPGTRLPAEQRLALVDAVRAERAVYESSGRVPWSEPMRAAAQEYLRAAAAARSAPARAFDRAIDHHTRANEIERAKEYVADKRAVLERRVVAVWDYTWANGKTDRWQLYADGTFSGGTSWSFTGDTVTFTGLSPTLPGGRWVDVCKVGQSGRTLSGKNQLGHIKFGVLVLP
jgi:hypothetical protein